MSRYHASPIEVCELAQSLPTAEERHIVTLSTSECAADGQSTIPVPADIIAALHDYKCGLLSDVGAARRILDCWRASLDDAIKEAVTYADHYPD